MPSLNHLVVHFRQYGFKHKTLYTVSVMLFFWSIYDGIISFISPILITERGFSNTLMGLIIGSSSMAGAVFDFILSKVLQNSYYRRLYLLMFAVCFVYPLILWQAKTIYLYLIAMALWGFYYDLQGFGNFDFVGREMETKEHASSFGVIGVFRSLGYLMAPLLVGLVIGQTLDWRPFALAWLFLFLSFFCFGFLFFYSRKVAGKRERLTQYKPVGLWQELNLWLKVGRFLFPVLIFTMLMNIQDAFFWTIGPIFSENSMNYGPFSGLLLAAYTFPTLIVGWFVGHFNTLFGGKKRTAFISFSLASLFLAGLFFFKGPIIILVLVFISSALSTLSFFSISGSYADYIEESAKVEKEIEGLGDFFTNIGYVLGPIVAGFLADRVGYAQAFAWLGIFGLVTTLGIAKITPKEIRVRVKVP